MRPSRGSQRKHAVVTRLQGGFVTDTRYMSMCLVEKSFDLLSSRRSREAHTQSTAMTSVNELGISRWDRRRTLGSTSVMPRTPPNTQPTVLGGLMALGTVVVFYQRAALHQQRADIARQEMQRGQ